MTHLETIRNRISENQKSDEFVTKLIGLDASKYFLFLKFNPETLKDGGTKYNIFIFPDQDSAEAGYDLAKTSLENTSVYFFPGLDHSPYGGHVASERTAFERFFTLNNLCHNAAQNGSIIISTMEALHQKLPPVEILKSKNLLIQVSDIVSPDELKIKLRDLGYQNSITVEEPATFSHKGGIFDIFPTSGKPFRIHYFDDMIEEIFLIDTETLKTKRDFPLESVNCGMSPRAFCNPEFSTNLRAAIPMPAVSHKLKYEKRKGILDKLSDSFLFESYSTYIPLFTEKNESLFDYFGEDKFKTHIFNSFKTLEEWPSLWSELLDEFSAVEKDVNSDCILPMPDRLYFESLEEKLKSSPSIHVNELEIALDIDNNFNDIEVKFEQFNHYIDLISLKNRDKTEYLKFVFEKIKNVFKHSGEILFFYTNEASKKEFQHLLEIYEFTRDQKNRISFLSFPLESGFFYENEKTLFLTEGDVFSSKRKKVKAVSQKDLDLFAEQIATMSVGDYVIHNDHGVGKYLGLQSLDLSEDKADFIVIEYTGKDKVYVPVYKMNLIQKHANSSATIGLDSLRTNKFSALKKRASQSIKKLAFDLLKLQAERESSKAFSFSEPDHYFREFELAFEFQETPDQTMAIERVLEDMQKPKPMDHLVCGDVGFGKTEVAIRAAFKAVMDNKQVVVLAPTTILTLQHYSSFKKRFKNFPVHIEYLSRFKSPKETKEVIEKLKAGTVDIVIGTHKLLSDKVKYNDLGLVVVDEEQRFGVNHKEKLKLLKSNVDFLTLTATPIPRTLQLSFLGLRDLSLIKTPPPKRQTIKTYIIKEDPLTLQTAIRKELKRGGQVFIVHNKVQDIEEFSGKIRELVPEANIVIGHGQLPEKELEKRMQGFYEGKYQILIATTIIESGIDIPNANTMIIDRADTYGLSQLHQLRGRIGRSDKKAYAYFVIPNDRNLTIVAEKRLKALQTYAEMGSGFNIASCDLEIRGAGDILGGNQSGHIEAIGLELYMELLQDAIRELKGEKQTFNRDIEITSPFPSYIPNNYIEDPSERLRQYKRLSNAKSLSGLDEMLDEFNDIYGPLPIEFKNLAVLLMARIHLMHSGLKSIQLNNQSISLQFDKEILEKNQELAGNIAQTFLSKPNLYHFSPDYKVLYKSKKELNQESFLDFCQKIAEQIVPC
ncbi:MAG: transcription-repair coupling factor [Bacteriovoracaceae bacterium]|nr:transcription-repair coupling factor [Bacteriovoracaceae bacterium]